MKNILLFGKVGQVGWELQRSLAPLGELLALDRHSTDFCGDLNQPERLAQTVRDWRPDVIVNAAAHTAVDKAESEPDLARCLNATAPAALARMLAHYGAQIDQSAVWCETESQSKSLAQTALFDEVRVVVDAQT